MKKIDFFLIYIKQILGATNSQQYVQHLWKLHSISKTGSIS